MGFDLHTHSVFSDGTDSPEALMAAAQEAGLEGLAVVDHDTTAGWDACAAALPHGMVLVRGAELSTHVERAGRRVSIHLLAYLFDPAEPAIVQALAQLRANRIQRGMTMVDRMVADGIPISRHDVLALADGAAVGRPHIGRALVARGLVDSVTDAFRSYLAVGGPYYEPQSDLDLVEAIGLVRGAGGVPVVAHPRSRSAAAITDEATLRGWVDVGLAGIEVDHPDHSAADRGELRTMAKTYGLIATGSSDYHGRNKEIRIGQDRAQASVVDAILAASSGVTPLVEAAH